MLPESSAPRATPDRTEQAAFDRGVAGDDRGEHRYPDEGQTGAERSSRGERDELKRRLAVPAFVAGLKRMATHVESPILHTPPASTVLDDLRELVAALDRRAPRLEREGEHDIARDAGLLRADALRRIKELGDGSAL